MLPCSLPYIRNIKKTIHTTIWPNHNNNNNNDESNYSASYPKKPAGGESVEGSAVRKVIIEKKGSPALEASCQTSEEVKVRSTKEVGSGTPHPLRRVRPDSPHVVIT